MNRLKLQVKFSVEQLQYDNEDVTGTIHLPDSVREFDSWIEVETFLLRMSLADYRCHIIDVVPLMKTFNEIIKESLCEEETDVESEHQEEEKTEDVSCSDVADVTSQDNLDIF